MKLSHLVRELRYKKGWGPDDLASRAKVSRTALYHLESGRTGRPQAGTLRKIARALDVSPEELLRECEGNPEADPDLPAEPVSQPIRRVARGSHAAASADAPVDVTQAPTDPVVSMALHRIGRMLGLPPQSLGREEALLAELVRPSSVIPPAAVRPADDDYPSGISPETARQLIEKFSILLCSPMAKGIAHIVEESFRLLPILPAISGPDDRLYGRSSQAADRKREQTASDPDRTGRTRRVN
jgi:transcriptional regulator with XRE-family HTH domain